MNQEDIDHANRLEFEKDYEELEKFFDEMDLDFFNEKYFKWMADFELLAIPSVGFSLDMDVDYSVVDMMFEMGLTPEKSVVSYWNLI